MANIIAAAVIASASFVGACGTEMAQVQLEVGDLKHKDTVTVRQAEHLTRMAAREPQNGVSNRCEYWTAAARVVKVSNDISKEDREEVLVQVVRAARRWCAMEEEETKKAEAVKQESLARQQLEEETKKRKADIDREWQEQARAKTDSLLSKANDDVEADRMLDAADDLDRISRMTLSVEQQTLQVAVRKKFEEKKPMYLRQKAREEARKRAEAAAQEREWRKEEVRRAAEERRSQAQESAFLGRTSTVATFRGEGVSSTDSFSAKQKWRIEWSSNDDIYIFIKDEKTGRTIDSAGGTTAGASVIRKSGSFFLTITGTEAWVVSVTQL
ncbi:MAG: hypothetical protein PHU25_17210 [Deltaproteobacteria bacterium]|nr:hypothetical protein [Deltaproteobacteria bacterium]